MNTNIILITGLHGCGKTTQIKLLKKHLEDKRAKVYISKADEGINFKKLIGKYDGSDVFFTTLLFVSLNYRRRINLLKEKDAGKVVLLDRWDDIFDFYHSNFGVLAKNSKLKKTLKEISFGKIKPDTVFYLRVSPKVAVSRCIKEKRFFNSTRVDESYQNRLFRFYEKSAKINNNWVVINGEGQKKEVFSDIIKNINK